MTKKMLKQDYLVKTVDKPRPSTSNTGSKFWRIEFTGITNKKPYVTYIDPSMKNFDKWIRVIENTGGRPQLRGLQIKKENVLNADSDFSIVNSKSSTFHDLFTIID